MERTRKKLVICFCASRAAASLNEQAWGVGMTFNPSASSIDVEDSVDLDVVISGLEDDVQLYSFKNMAEFKFSIVYDMIAPSVGDYHLPNLRPDTDTNADVAWRLDDFEEQALNITTPSYDWNSDSINSSDTSTLATVSFLGSGLKDDALSSLNIRVDDDLENTLSVSLGNRDEKDIADNSVPANMLLLGCGLIGLARLKKNFKLRG